MVALVVRTVPELEGIAGLDLYRIEN